MSKVSIRITEKDGVKKVIGVYDDEAKVFVTKRDKNRHLLHKYNAWAFDKELINMLPNEALLVVEEKHGYTYSILNKDFKNGAKCLNFNQHRLQLYLPITKFRKARSV